MTNGIANFASRELPFPHDGFGQDADWVRANFTNAEEILAVGYDNWVDAQVGIDLTNGLYKFTACFPEDPPEATELTVGGCSVCVTNDPSRAALALDVPELVFVNDDNRTSRWYRVAVSLFSPVATNITVHMTHVGDSGPRFASDRIGEFPVSLTDVDFGIDHPADVATHWSYFACTNKAGTGEFAATCEFAGQGRLSVSRRYNVIEPIRKLVSTVQNTSGYVNPSRLVYGTNAWIEIDRNGDCPQEKIKWRVISGPGELVSTNRSRACVRPTSNDGTVVVEAAFGSDALVQPRFVLPIVMKRRMPIEVYYVAEASGCKPIRAEAFESDLHFANRVFAQVGIEFYQSGNPHPIADESYSQLPEYGVYFGTDGHAYRSKRLSAKLISLLEMLPATNDSIRVVYVSDIVAGTRLAFSVREQDAVIMGRLGSESVLAHELGHCVGLDDIYSCNKRNPAMMMPGWNDQAYSEIFEDLDNDWGAEDGRSFYEADDTHGTLINELLMNGFNDYDGCDIPSGRVLGYPASPNNAFDRQMIKVGAGCMLKENR